MSLGVHGIARRLQHVIFKPVTSMRDPPLGSMTGSHVDAFSSGISESLHGSRAATPTCNALHAGRADERTLIIFISLLPHSGW